MGSRHGDGRAHSSNGAGASCRLSALRCDGFGRDRSSKSTCKAWFACRRNAALPEEGWLAGQGDLGGHIAGVHLACVAKPGPLQRNPAFCCCLHFAKQAWPTRGKPGPVPTSPAHSRPGDKPGPVSHNVSLRCWLLAEKMQDIVSRGARTTPNHPPGETRRQCGWQRETREEVARGRWRDVALAGSAEPALVSRDTAIARRLHVAGARGLPPPRTPGPCGGQSHSVSQSSAALRIAGT